MTKRHMVIEQPFHSNQIKNKDSFWLKFNDFPSDTKNKLNYILYEEYTIGYKDLYVDLFPDLIETLCFEIHNNNIRVYHFGKHTKHRIVAYKANHKYINIRFSPLGSIKINSNPSANYQNKLISVFEPSDKTVIDALPFLLSNSIDERIEGCLSLLHQQIKYKTPAIIYNVVDFIHNNSDSQTKITTKSAANNFGYSERQIRNIFLDNLGSSPKEVAQIFRFWSCINEINTLEILPPLSELTYKFSFYDDSHFLKFFQKYTNGLTPSQYWKKINSIY